MKKALILTSLWFLAYKAQSQFAKENIPGLVSGLRTEKLSKEAISKAVNSFIKDPELYNDLWRNFLGLSFVKNNHTFNLLRDFDIKFKTFQLQNSSVTGLGFSYDFHFDFARFTENQTRKSHDFGFNATGNVAFKHALNPNDFLESKLHYTLSNYIGGVIQNTDSAVLDKLNDIEDRLVTLKDMESVEASALWEEFGHYLILTNQYYYSIAPKFALESDQNFTKNQFTPGILIGIGAKGWNNQSTLSKLNILDYPFALLRMLTGTDHHFTPYGSTLPTVQIGLDFIIPSNDVVRKELLNSLVPYPRFRFEVGFRTFISRIHKENIFFNADYRLYNELNAKDVIKMAHLDSHKYFVMALQSTTGMYVSYAKGKLPFDAVTDEVYSIGFNYKF